MTCLTTLTIISILILSGILSQQADEVINTYSNWINLIIEDEMDGWVLLKGNL